MKNFIVFLIPLFLTHFTSCFAQDNKMHDSNETLTNLFAIDLAQDHVSQTLKAIALYMNEHPQHLSPYDAFHLVDLTHKIRVQAFQQPSDRDPMVAINAAIKQNSKLNFLNAKIDPFLEIPLITGYANEINLLAAQSPEIFAQTVFNSIEQLMGKTLQLNVKYDENSKILLLKKI